jgi:3-oxoacyl-[acyl-carrier protein] reductase
MLLKNKIALITGAGQGIGFAIAQTLVLNGASVIITGRSPSIHAVAKSLSAKSGKATAIQGDLTDDAHIKSVVDTCKRQYGTIDILVNNAGLLLPAVIGMISMSDVRKMVDVNIIAMIQLTQYMTRLMDPKRGGSVINLCSIVGVRGMEGMSAYSATKGAVAGFTYAASKELSRRNIRVNAIAPGFIDTEMTRALPVSSYKKGTESIRMGRLGKPQDIANAALFFASDLSAYVTGQILGVDGGMIA